jgi:hypothetical protein
VLHLHLKRFEYDPVRDANVKINDRFEFHEEASADIPAPAQHTHTHTRMHERTHAHTYTPTHKACYLIPLHSSSIPRPVSLRLFLHFPPTHPPTPPLLSSPLIPLSLYDLHSTSLRLPLVSSCKRA